MVLWVLRALFIVLMAAVGFSMGGETGAGGNLAQNRASLMLAAIVVACVIIGVDLFVPRKSLAALSGAFLGLLVGMVTAFGLSLVQENV